MSKIIAVAVLVVVALVDVGAVWQRNGAKTALKIDYTLSKAMIDNNSYVAVSVPYYPKVETYGTIIDCLVKWESGGNENAVGDSGLAHGLLQFHAPTFEQYCVEKFGYANDIWNPEIQKSCASEMIESGLGYHWSTWDKCNAYSLQQMQVP